MENNVEQSVDNNVERSVKSRLLEFIRSQHMTVRRFEVKCGFPNAFVSNMKRSIMPDRMKIISEAFPMLNVSWLITGLGDMLIPMRPAGKENVPSSVTTMESSLVSLSERAMGSMEQLVTYHNDVSRRYQEYLERVLEMQSQTFATLEAERGNVSKLLDQLELMQQQNAKVQQQNEKLIDMLRDIIDSKLA